MHDKPFDILTLNETRLDDSIPNLRSKSQDMILLDVTETETAGVLQCTSEVV